MSSENTEDEDDILRISGYVEGSNQILLSSAQSSDSHSYQFGTLEGRGNTSTNEKSERDNASSYIFSSDLPKKTASVSHQTSKKSQITQADKPKFPTSILSEDTSATMPPIFLDHKKITFIKRIGDPGGFGEVWLGKLSGSLIVIKTLLDTKITPEHEEAFKKEAEIMKSLRNPTIVFYYGFCIQDKKSYIVMEYMQNGSLNSLLKKKKVEEISWLERYIIAKDITEGLSYLHGVKILHRDLKSPNVLLTHDYRGKLADFGLAYQQIKTSTLSKTLELKESNSSGTLQWMAPELFSLSPIYSKASDIYAYGIILWEMATHKIPYPGVSPAILQESIKRGERAKIPTSIPEETYAKMIEQCWAQNPKERPTTQMLSDILDKLILKSTAPKKIINNLILLDKHPQKKDVTFPQDKDLPVNVLIEEKELPDLPRNLPAKKKKEKWTALYDYETKEEGCLSFRNGETINILEKSGNWWLGELNGKVGKVPSNYLQKYSSIHSLKPLPPSSPTKGQGLFDKQMPKIDITSSPKEKSNDEIKPKLETPPKKLLSEKPNRKFLDKNRIFSGSKKNKPPSIPSEPSLEEKTTSQKKPKKLLSDSNTNQIEIADQHFSVNEYVKQAQQALSQDNKPIAIQCLTKAVKQYAKEWFKINSKVIFPDKITNPKLSNASITKRIKYCDPTLQEISLDESEWNSKLCKVLLKNPHVWNLKFNPNFDLMNHQLNPLLNKNSALCELNIFPKKIKMALMANWVAGAGKTALAIQFTEGYFFIKYDPTIEESYRKIIEIDGNKYMLEIGEIGGNNEFMYNSYARENDVFILVFTIISRSSFNSILDFREMILRVKDVEKVPMIIVGNKCDLEEQRNVTRIEAEELARKCGALYIETSAKTNMNVDKLFYDAAKMFLNSCMEKDFKQTKQGIKIKEWLYNNRELNKKLYEAVKQNHIKKVQKFIHQGVSLVAPCQDEIIVNKTLLDIASEQGDIGMLVILLEQYHKYGFSIETLPLKQFKATLADLPSCSLTDLIWLLTSSWRNSILTLLTSLSVTLEKSITLKDIFSNLNDFSDEQKNYLLHAWDKNINKISVSSPTASQNPTNSPTTIPKEIENEPKESSGFNMTGK